VNKEVFMKRIIIFIAAFSYAVSAHAGGFEQVNQSAAGAGVSNAFAATASDASALAYNPAGIAWLPGVNVSGGLRTDYRNASVKIPGGIAPNINTEPFAAHIFATWVPRDSRLAAGIGFAPLYQVNNNWSNGTFASPSGLTKIMVDHTTADLVYAVNSDLAVGLGGDWYVTRANLTQGASGFKGTDLASFGGHASLMWKPVPAWSLGAVLRSGASISMSKANNRLSFKLPDQATIAIAHDFAEVLRLETDVKWTRWSALKNINVTGIIPQTNTLNLRDTLTAMAGLTWTWRENTQLRVGYAYDQGANKSLNFNPMIADQDGHRVSLGAGGDMFGMHADLAYQYTFYSRKTATGTYAGDYRDRRQSIMFTVSNQFD